MNNLSLGDLCTEKSWHHASDGYLRCNRARALCRVCQRFLRGGDLSRGDSAQIREGWYLDWYFHLYTSVSNDALDCRVEGLTSRAVLGLDYDYDYAWTRVEDDYPLHMGHAPYVHWSWIPTHLRL